MRSTIVVTGAARGIGAAIAKQLLDQGYHVIGIDCQKNPEQWDISKTMTSDQIFTMARHLTRHYPSTRNTNFNFRAVRKIRNYGVSKCSRSINYALHA